MVQALMCEIGQLSMQKELTNFEPVWYLKNDASPLFPGNDIVSAAVSDTEDIVLEDSKEKSKQSLDTISKEKSVTVTKSLTGSSQNQQVKCRPNDVITEWSDGYSFQILKFMKISGLLWLLFNISGVSGELHAKAWFRTDNICKDPGTYLPFFGERLELICEYGLSRDQVEEIKWHKIENHEVLFHYKQRGITLNPAGHMHHFTQKGHSLTMKSVAMADEGLYSCTVIQRQTNNMATANVNLQGKIKKKPVKQELTNELNIESLPVPLRNKEFQVEQGFNEITFVVIIMLSDPELMCSPPEILLHIIYKDEELNTIPSTCESGLDSTRCEYHIQEKSLRGSGRHKIIFCSRQFGIESDSFTYEMNYVLSETTNSFKTHIVDEVKESDDSKTNPGMLIGVIVGVVAVLVLTALLVAIILKKKSSRTTGHNYEERQIV